MIYVHLYGDNFLMNCLKEATTKKLAEEKFGKLCKLWAERVRLLKQSPDDLRQVEGMLHQALEAVRQKNQAEFLLSRKSQSSFDVGGREGTFSSNSGLMNKGNTKLKQPVQPVLPASLLSSQPKNSVLPNLLAENQSPVKIQSRRNNASKIFEGLNVPALLNKVSSMSTSLGSGITLPAINIPLILCPTHWRSRKKKHRTRCCK